MTKLVIEIKNLEQLRAAFQSSPQRVRQKLDKALTVSAIIVQRMARQESPIDQGILRSSIGIRFLLLGAAVAPTVNYALYVHEGTGRFARNGNGRSTPWVYKTRGGKFVFTRGTRANPFMERAARIAEPQVHQVFSRAVDEVVSETAS